MNTKFPGKSKLCTNETTQKVSLSKIPDETQQAEHNAGHRETDRDRIIPKVRAASLLVTRA